MRNIFRTLSRANTSAKYIPYIVAGQHIIRLHYIPLIASVTVSNCQLFMFFYIPHAHAALPKCLQKRDVRCGYFHHQRDPIEREGYPLIGGQLSADCINKLILAFPKCLYKIVDENNKDDLDYEYPVMKKLMLTMTKCVDAKLCRNSVIHRNRFMTFIAKPKLSVIGCSRYWCFTPVFSPDDFFRIFVFNLIRSIYEYYFIPLTHIIYSISNK